MIPFTYSAGTPFDGWRVTDTGDCDDYALSVAWELADRSALKLLLRMLTLHTVIWRVRSDGNGILPRHAALWVRGKGWIDSTERTWRDTAFPHSRVWPIILPVALVYMALGLVARAAKQKER